MLVHLLALSSAWGGDAIDTIVVPAPQGPDPLAVPAAVTVLPIEGAPAIADVGDLVERAPGAHVQRLGGLGDWSSVSIRGSSVRQPLVALDGVPLNPDGAATNLSEIPLAGLSRVEVWRGNAPFALGAAPIGGVVDLITGEPAHTASIAAGSYGTTRISATGGARDDHGERLFVADAFGTRGDYVWYDDHGTLYDADDDALRRRANNDKAQVSGLARVQEGRVTALASALTRDEGLPGHSGAPTSSARLDTARAMGAVEGVLGRADAGARLRAWGIGRRETLDDRAGEIGLSAQWTTSITASAGLHADGLVTPTQGVTLRGVTELRGDRFDARSRWNDEDPLAASRAVVSAAAGADLSRGPWLVSPVILASRYSASSGDARAPVGSIDPKIGARYARGPLALRANVGRYLRAPDTLELFGDHGDLLGNPGLRPERGTSGDAGIVVARSGATLDLTAFGTRADDLITWVQTSQRTFEARNLGEARILGLEAAGTFSHGPVALAASATRTWSTNLSTDPAYAGNALPRTPAWDASATASFTQGAWRLGYSLDATAGNYWDATNWYASPTRVIHGVSGRWERRGFAVGLDVLDVGNRIASDVPANPLDPRSPRVPAAVTDFTGFPLAGRTVLASVAWGAP